MKSLFAHRFTGCTKDSSHEVLLVFVATSNFDPEKVAHLIEGEIQRDLAPDTILFLVRDGTFEAALKCLTTDAATQALLDRYSKRTCVVLASYDVRGNEARREHVTGPEPMTVVQFDDFRRRACTSIFRSRGGFVQATSSYHFENPSGRHTERFMRLSNIMVSGPEIAFWAFCLLPFVGDEVRYIYVDTPALFCVIASLNEQRHAFDKTMLHVDNFRSYDGATDLEPDHSGQTLVIISASSSGGLSKFITTRHGISKSNIVHMLYLGHGTADTNVVCNLKTDKKNNPDGIVDLPMVENAKSCSLCRANSIPIRLHGDHFDFAGPQPKALVIKKPNAPASLSETMASLAGNMVFSIKIGQRSAERERDFFVQTEKLLEAPKFCEQLDFAIRRLVPRSVTHIVAVDDGSEPFAKRIAEASPNGATLPNVLKRNELDNIDPNSSPTIVVAGLVIESGRSLTDISRDLRSVAENSPILYLVGLEKTSGLERRRSLKKTLVQSKHPIDHEYVAVESIVLPISSGWNSWSEEHRLLVDADVREIVETKASGFLRERLKRLSKQSEPLVDDLFLPRPNGTPLKLQTGFVFWPSDLPGTGETQADIYFTISSVLQQLRANAELSDATAAIRSSWFHQTLLDPSNFGRFNDDIIQACLLRAATPAELNFRESPDHSREMARIASRVFEASSTGSSRNSAACEFMMAIALGRLLLRDEDEDDLMSRSEQASGLLSAIRDIAAIQIRKRRA